MLLILSVVLDAPVSMHRKIVREMTAWLKKRSVEEPTGRWAHMDPAVACAVEGRLEDSPRLMNAVKIGSNTAAR